MSTCESTEDTIAIHEPEYESIGFKKAEMMDRMVKACKNKITSSEIYNIVYQLFGFDLDSVPTLKRTEYTTTKVFGLPSRMVIDPHLKTLGEKVSGAEIREMINEIFGINLDAISALEGKEYLYILKINGLSSILKIYLLYKQILKI